MLRDPATQNLPAKQGPESDLLGLDHQIEVREGWSERDTSSFTSDSREK